MKKHVSEPTMKVEENVEMHIVFSKGKRVKLHSPDDVHSIPPDKGVVCLFESTALCEGYIRRIYENEEGAFLELRSLNNKVTIETSLDDLTGWAYIDEFKCILTQ